MARGIDFKGVNLVINYDCPSSTISYIHRIGEDDGALIFTSLCVCVQDVLVELVDLEKPSLFIPKMT